MQRSGKLISGYIYNYIAYFRASLDVTPREGAVGPKKSRSCSPSVGLPIPVLAAPFDADEFITRATNISVDTIGDTLAPGTARASSDRHFHPLVLTPPLPLPFGPRPHAKLNMHCATTSATMRAYSYPMRAAVRVPRVQVRDENEGTLPSRP